MSAWWLVKGEQTPRRLTNPAIAKARLFTDRWQTEREKIKVDHNFFMKSLCPLISKAKQTQALLYYM